MSSKRAPHPRQYYTSWKKTMVVQAKNILIATGGRALVPPIEGKELTIISDQVLDLPKKPERCDPYFCVVSALSKKHKDTPQSSFYRFLNRYKDARLL